MRRDFVVVSEAVTQGHPDKLCDQISDAIVDGFLAEDPGALLDAECALSAGIVFVAAHFASPAKIDVTGIARRVIRNAGYGQGEFNADDCTILTSLVPTTRAPWSATGDYPAELPAAQHATVYGFACTDTDEFMPMPVTLAHDLARTLDTARRHGTLPYVSPDAKIQVAVQYRDRRPERIHGISIVVSCHPDAGIGRVRLERDLMDAVVEPSLAGRPLQWDSGTRLFMSAEPSFAVGGPALHSGLTGRKTAMDTYGGFARQGAAALSGKDPLRVDRSSAYAARYAARNVVAAGLARECEVQLSYSIGQAEPISLSVDTFGTAEVGEEDLERRLRSVFDFRPGAIDRILGLRGRFATGTTTFFEPLATYGQFGRRDLDLPWEASDKIDALLAA